MNLWLVELIQPSQAYILPEGLVKSCVIPILALTMVAARVLKRPKV